MIRKPSGVQREDRLHAAVGDVIRAGGEVRAVGRKARRAGSTLFLVYFFGMMGFGLLMSSTPIWFKAAIAAGGYQLYKFLKGRIASRSTD